MVERFLAKEEAEGSNPFSRSIRIIYVMAKRSTGVGKRRRTHSHKTKKRLAIKEARLAAQKKK